MEPPALESIIKDKKGRKIVSSKLIGHLRLIYQTVVLGGWVANRLPKRFLHLLLAFIQKLGFDFSKFLMVGLPHENFTEKGSLVFLPDSKENLIKTSDGKIIVPHQLVIEMLKRVCAYDPEHSIAQSYYCVCRIARECKDFPRGIGCMIVGPGASDMVERDQGKYVKLDDAIAYINKEIIPRRLSTFISVFPGDLRYFWGVKPHHSKFSFEVCFCCPCCCVLKKPHFFIPNEPILGEEPFIDIRGFKARKILSKCEGCGECIEHCTLNRIRLIQVTNNKGQIETKATNENCIGCGNCVPHCPNNAIEIVTTESFDKLEDLLGVFEYFDLNKEDFLKKLNEKYQEVNRKL